MNDAFKMQFFKQSDRTDRVTLAPNRHSLILQIKQHVSTMFILTKLFVSLSRALSLQHWDHQWPPADRPRSMHCYFYKTNGLFVHVVNNIDFIFHRLCSRNRIQSFCAAVTSVSCLFCAPCTIRTDTTSWTTNAVQVAVITSMVLNCHQSDCFVTFFVEQV